MDKKIKINCEGAAVMSLDELLDFQGELKVLGEEEHRRFREVILKYGVTDPVNIWRQTKGKTVIVTNYILSGHQRCKILKGLRNEGFEIPPIPINYVDAPTREIAKEILLAQVSNYGKVTSDGLNMFMIDAGLKMEIATDLMCLTDLEFTSGEPELSEAKEVNLTPYKKTHILLSFPPDKFLSVAPLIEKIMENEGVEYEPSSN
jgi:hypothetical protein